MHEPVRSFSQSIDTDLSAGSSRSGYLNLLEPASLIEAFLKDPPVGFTSMGIRSSDHVTPAFLTSFDLLTTLDPPVKRVVKPILGFLRLDRLLKPRTLFIGTTVSEYLLYPSFGDPMTWISDLLKEAGEQNVPFLILKDIPSNSPLLTPDENKTADELREHCQRTGFQVLAGQALAYVPIDFSSIDEYLRRLSASRRKDIRRKLRTRSQVEVEEIPLGNPVFSDEAFVRQLFGLYLNVYRQSAIHFDQLSFPFFGSMLRNRADPGVVFVYRDRKKIIGYNLCFVYRDNLIDKYIGLVYPDARELNLYFLSWVYNLEYAIKHRLNYYVAGWTDPEVKVSLGAELAFTQHAVYLRNPVLRAALKRLKRFFESDQNWAAQKRKPSIDKEAAGGAG
ncbi:MAG: GNAT family N-acetyltransferase [Nitrospirae bacterium]|nr:GNAT family N-acetyltransferase [Nitrospirota bacterium]